MGVSIREFARRQGCDDKVVRRAIAAKRLVLREDGTLDPALIGTDWRHRRVAVEAASDADIAAADTLSVDTADSRGADTSDGVRTEPHAPEPTDQSAEFGLISTEDAARLLMVSGQWIRQLVKKGYIAKPERGKVPLAGAVQGYVKFLKDEERQATKAAARTRIDTARAEEIELRVALKKKELMAVEEVFGILDEVVGTYLTRLAGLPARITRDMTLRGRIDDEIFKIRTELTGLYEGRARDYESATEATPHAND